MSPQFGHALRRPPDASECPLCHGPTGILPCVRGRTFRICEQCDLISVPCAEHLSLTAQRARYALHRNNIENPGYVRMLQRSIRALEESCPSARRVLDYGSGPTPVLVELLRRGGYDASGYDPLFHPDGDFSRPFDAITCIETFEHFADPDQELSRISSLLRPGGVLVVTTQLHRGAGALGDWWYVRDPTHVAFYSPQTFRWIGSAYALGPPSLESSSRIVFGRGRGTAGAGGDSSA